jgi:hypothetical protein
MQKLHFLLNIFCIFIFLILTKIICIKCIQIGFSHLDSHNLTQTRTNRSAVLTIADLELDLI